MYNNKKWKIFLQKKNNDNNIKNNIITNGTIKKNSN